MMIIPKPLEKGARIAILGGSSPSSDYKAEDFVRAAKEMGFTPVLYKSATAKHGYLAGTDRQRASDINAAFADDSIDGIVAIRGGYGMPRILPLLDFQIIRRHPKFFAGYSDVTALHTAINQSCGFCTYHMPMVGAWAGGLDEYTLSYVKAMLFRGRAECYEDPQGAPPRKTLVPGTAEGTICGGNLSLLAASLGTPWEIDTRGKILFLEDVGEAPYRIDGMLTQLRNGGKLNDAAGIILGDWHNCRGDENAQKNGLSLELIFEELIVPAGRPTFMGVVCGHCSPTMSLPLGCRFRMDADACMFTQE
ncbi:MAG: LD-carboxypeptidase [Clostridiaceae bacterium]|nr:LD-carboxypeptidase [Clostridiaceae bacterium]